MAVRLIMYFVAAVLIYGALVLIASYAGFMETVSLNKTEWQCTAQHEAITASVAGKIVTPRVEQVCDTWTRIK